MPDPPPRLHDLRRAAGRDGRRPGDGPRARIACSTSRPVTTSGCSATSRGSRSSGAAAGGRWARRCRSSPDRQLATVLFTDIVDSTVRLRAVGDAAWRDQLAAHNARLREQLNVFRGREVKTTGDGLLAVFDSPTRAVRCAAAMVAACDAMGLRDPGRACTPARWSSSATTSAGSPSTSRRASSRWPAPGEVLLTPTTADLVEGSGIRARGRRRARAQGDRRRPPAAGGWPRPA